MHISPSQIATWRGCHRKWWYSRNRPRSESPHASFGTRVHSIREQWLTSQTLPAWGTGLDDELRCAIAGLHELPMPGTVSCEVPLKLVHEGIEYVGVADVLGIDGTAENLETYSALVADHKTTGDFKWAKTEDDLENDPQWVFYGHWACEAFRVPVVRGLWHYLRRKPAASKPVRIVATAEQLRERFQRMHETDGKAIAAAWSVTDPTELERRPEPEPGKEDFCEAFGGCPFHAECWDGATIERACAALRKAKRPMPPDIMEVLNPPAAASRESMISDLLTWANVPQQVKDLLEDEVLRVSVDVPTWHAHYLLAPPLVREPVVTSPFPEVAQASAAEVGVPESRDAAPKRKTRADKGKPRGARTTPAAVPPASAPSSFVAQGGNTLRGEPLAELPPAGRSIAEQMIEIIDASPPAGRAWRSTDDRAARIGRLVLGLVDEIVGHVAGDSANA